MKYVIMASIKDSVKGGYLVNERAFSKMTDAVDWLLEEINLTGLKLGWIGPDRDRMVKNFNRESREDLKNFSYRHYGYACEVVFGATSNKVRGFAQIRKHVIH